MLKISKRCKRLISRTGLYWQKCYYKLLWPLGVCNRLNSLTVTRLNDVEAEAFLDLGHKVTKLSATTILEKVYVFQKDQRRQRASYHD